MKKLISNINSAYLDAANRLRPKRKKKRIVAYVESYDDIFFWRSVLNEFENEEREFEVMLPSRTNLNRGKKTAMMNKLGENLGSCMIACVDADLDYLLQRHTQNSAHMLDNPYVVHTYAYAIESFQCYAPSLHNVCVMATLNDRNIFNFEEYLKMYSEIVYELFIWLVWLHREGRFSDFPLSSFNNICSVEQLNVWKPITALEQLRKNVNRKIAYLQKNVSAAKGKLTPLKIELEQLGLKRENTYMFIQGHHLMENVVSSAIDPVCTILRREREKEIKQLAGSNMRQMDNELACYQHSQAQPSQMIRRNTQYKDAPPYQLIKQHIERIINALNTEEAQGEQKNT